MQRITDIVVQSGANLQDLNLPIDPNGVVYNSIARTPIAGATLTLLDAGSGSAAAGELLRRSGAAGPGHARERLLQVRPQLHRPGLPERRQLPDRRERAGGGYVAGYSQIIPPTSGPATAPFAVPACPGGADDAIAAHGAALRSAAVRVRAGARCRRAAPAPIYHVHLMLDGSQLPGSSQIFNNHIPLDPTLDGAVAITKTTPMLNVTRGQLVPYVITVHNQFEVAAPRRHDRRPLPGGLPLRRGLGAGRRRAGRADGRRPRARLERSHAGGLRRAQAAAAARRGRRRQRGRVRQPRAGRAQPDGQRDVGRGDRDRARRAGSDVRLHRRDRQGVRRRQSQRGPGRRRSAASPACAS